MPNSGQGGPRYPDTAPRTDDPTQRTNEGLYREIEHLRELLEGKITSVAGSVVALKELTDAKFDANRENVQTAFKAANEAAGKQEATFKEQIAAIAETMNVQDRGRGAEIAALSKLVERSDARGGGFSSAGALLLAALGGIGTLIGIAATIYALTKP
jgi:hypothetical protein